MNKDQLQDGVFCSLKMGRWDARKKVSPSRFGENVPEKIIRAKQDTIEDRTLLDHLTQIRRSAKKVLTKNSFPFPIDGIFWIPKDKIPMLDKKFNKYKAEYKEHTDSLCNSIENMKNTFKKKYPDYYKSKNYPSIALLKEKFYFYWTFMQFSAPTNKSQVLSSSIYKREQRKFSNMVTEMEEMTINLIGNSLLSRIDRLAKQCDSGKINGRTINSINSFLKQWENLWEGHIDEKKLKKIMATLKMQMKGVSSERVRSNDDFRNKLGKKLEKISGAIKILPDFKLKRKLDI